MKLLMLTSVEFNRNGITTVIMNYYQSLINKIDTVDILGGSIEIDEAYEVLLAKNGSKYYGLTSRKKDILKYCKDLYFILKKNNYDVVHVHGSSRIIALELFIAKIAGVKVRAAHSHSTHCEHKKIHFLFTPIFFWSYNCALSCGKLAGQWMFGRREFKILKNGMNFSSFKFDEEIRNLMRKKYGIREQEVVIGNVSSFLPVKNHMFMLNLIENLKSNSFKCKLILIGSGEKYDEIKTIIQKEEYRDRVICVGNQQEVFKYYNMMDVFILPSFYEGMPMVLIEAQANGLHSIASKNVSQEINITKLIDYCSIDENQKSLNEWVETIEKITSLKNKRSELSCSCIDALEKEGYSIEKNANELLSIYKELMNS